MLRYLLQSGAVLSVCQFFSYGIEIVFPYFLNIFIARLHIAIGNCIESGQNQER